VTFTVYGEAQAKGSMRAFGGHVTDSNRHVRGWAQLVAEAASRELAARGGQQITGPVLVSVRFGLKRPIKYRRLGIHVAHCVKPDIDKLVRGVLDALSGVVFGDDKQVVTLSATKVYAPADGAPYATITVERTTAAASYDLPLLDEATP
jgi:Holliday junction resolvase RusA-like endonuclease